MKESDIPIRCPYCELHIKGNQQYEDLWLKSRSCANCGKFIPCRYLRHNLTNSQTYCAFTNYYLEKGTCDECDVKDHGFGNGVPPPIKAKREKTMKQRKLF